jgi:hypothetical protein
MAETAFLAAVAAFLKNRPGLSPAPLQVGPAEPVIAAELPAVVLALDEVRRLQAGLGERSELVTGALAVRAEIDLANPVLPEEPSLRLLSDDRLELTLPHGGQVRKDGTAGALGPQDLTVTVAGSPRQIVTGTPGPGQVRANAIDAEVGRLVFGAPLPATGLVVAEYFLGQWERGVVRLSGSLRVDICDATAEAVSTLSAGAVDALLSPDAAAAVRRLVSLSLERLGSIGAPETDFADSRRRSARFRFEYEHEVNQPESSGGIIRRIPVTTRLSSLSVNAESAEVVEAIFTESS